MNLDTLQKAAEAATELEQSGEFNQDIWTQYYDQCEPVDILKLIDIARAAKALLLIRPGASIADRLFKALEGVE